MPFQTKVSDIMIGISLLTRYRLTKKLSAVSAGASSDTMVARQRSVIEEPSDKRNLFKLYFTKVNR